MKTILFLSLVFGCNLIANAHQTVKSSDIDNLHFGDSIIKLSKEIFKLKPISNCSKLILQI